MMQDDGRSTEVRGWAGSDAVKMARTPGPTGPGFELGLLQEICSEIPSQRKGGEFYLTRDMRDSWSASHPLSFCWRIWDQTGRCKTFRMTRAR